MAILNTVTNRHTPMKIRRVRTKRKPKWLDRKILAAIKYRNKLLPNSESLEFKIARTRVNRLIKRVKTQLYQNLIHENRLRSSYIWKLFAELRSPGNEFKKL